MRNLSTEQLVKKLEGILTSLVLLTAIIAVIVSL